MTVFSALRNPILRQAATAVEIQDAERRLGFALPAELAAALQESNGWSDETGCLFYATDEISERNEVWEVSSYAPDYLAVADDGGGRIALVKKEADTCPIYVSDSGDMSPASFVVVSSSLVVWIADGCPFRVAGARGAAIEAHELVDVYMVRLPSNGLKGLSHIRQILQLQIPLNELKAHADALPCLLLKGVTFALFKKRAAALGDIGGVLEGRPIGAA